MSKFGVQIHTSIIYSKKKLERLISQKQSVLCNDVLGEGEDIFLQKITSINATKMDRKWYSKVSTDVALVKGATHESNGFSRRTKK